MISGFHLIQNTRNTRNTPPSIHGFNLIQNSQSHPQSELQSPLHTYQVRTTSIEEEEEDNEYQDNDKDYQDNEYQDNDKDYPTITYTSTNSSNPNNYITVTYANEVYLTIITARLTYQTISGMSSYITVDALSAQYLTIADASANYIPIGGLVNYLTIADASNNYLARTGSSVTSDATKTTFSNNLSVNGTFQVQDIYISGNGNGIGITNSPSTTIGSGTVVIGTNISNTNIVDSVIIGSTATGSNSSVAIGASSSAAGSSVAVGATSSAAGSSSIAIGANSSAIWNNSVAIGYGSTATEANQIMLGTANETVYCPGQLSLSSNITLHSQTIPIEGQLGYTLLFYLYDNAPITSDPTTYASSSPSNIGIGTWLITGVVTVQSSITSGSETATFTISTSNAASSHNPYQLIVSQTFNPSYTTSSFNYSNVIYNDTSQLWYILISTSSTSTISTLTTNAYINATRIA